jgi:hypothetical protein
MADEKSKDAVDAIKTERADAKANATDGKSAGSKAGATGKRPTTRRKRKTKAQMAEEIFPLDHWRKVSDFCLDGATTAAGTSPRSSDEKDAVAVTGRALAVKHLGATQYAEEIMFLMVVLPIGVSIAVEAVQNRRAKMGAPEVVDTGEPPARVYGGGNAKSTRSDTGQVGERQDVSDPKGA